jgi:CheY-like chemotaxis protein
MSSTPREKFDSSGPGATPRGAQPVPESSSAGFERGANTIMMRAGHRRGGDPLSASNMQKTRVLDVGNCDPDHGAIRGLLLANFDVEVERVMFVDEALGALGKSDYALVLVNRLIFADESDGMELIRRMRADANQKTPVMLVSNFAEAQERAIAAGAIRGFGKAALGAAESLNRLAAVLPARS